MASKIKKCPYCAEDIQFDAIKCRYCKEFLEEDLSTNSSRPISQNHTSKYVRCDNCRQDILGFFKKDFLGFHIYKCNNCGIKTKYPLGEFYFGIYLGILILGILLFFANWGVSLWAILVIPILIHHFNLKSKYPNYINEEYHSNKA